VEEPDSKQPRTKKRGGLIALYTKKSAKKETDKINCLETVKTKEGRA